MTDRPTNTPQAALASHGQSRGGAGRVSSPLQQRDPCHLSTPGCKKTVLAAEPGKMRGLLVSCGRPQTRYPQPAGSHPPAPKAATPPGPARGPSPAPRPAAATPKGSRVLDSPLLGSLFPGRETRSHTDGGRRDRGGERAGSERAAAESRDAGSAAGGRRRPGGGAAPSRSPGPAALRTARCRPAPQPEPRPPRLPSPRGCEIPDSWRLLIADCGAERLRPGGGGPAGRVACGFFFSFFLNLAPRRTISSGHASLRVDCTSLGPSPALRGQRQALGVRRGSGWKSAPPFWSPPRLTAPSPSWSRNFPGIMFRKGRNPARKYMRWLRIARARAQRYKV
ncbi:unnamed protein product [Rangifer tarandus platyrhynchus]|uniref:Uncharacterized protein n=1 Tax=Rangifer tarandus platyrhynchus TaxID=3082113 RepID=A0AC59ZTM5_RANTA